jgi:hypothetical protein
MLSWAAANQTPGALLPLLSLSLFFSTLLPTTWPRPVVSTTRPRPAVSTACLRPRRLLRLPAHLHRPSPPPGPAVGGGHTAAGTEKSDMSVWREKSGRRERRRSAPPQRRGRLPCPVTGSTPSWSRLVSPLLTTSRAAVANSAAGTRRVSVDGGGRAAAVGDLWRRRGRGESGG